MTRGRLTGWLLVVLYLMGVGPLLAQDNKDTTYQLAPNNKGKAYRIALSFVQAVKKEDWPTVGRMLGRAQSCGFCVRAIRDQKTLYKRLKPSLAYAPDSYLDETWEKYIGEHYWFPAYDPGGKRFVTILVGLRENHVEAIHWHKNDPDSGELKCTCLPGPDLLKLLEQGKI